MKRFVRAGEPMLQLQVVCVFGGGRIDLDGDLTLYALRRRGHEGKRAVAQVA